MDLKELIAKMDQIEQQPVQLNEEVQQLDEIAPLVLVGAGMGLKWLWDKFTQSQEEADRLKKEAEDAKRRGEEEEAGLVFRRGVSPQRALMTLYQIYLL